MRKRFDRMVDLALAIEAGPGDPPMMIPKLITLGILKVLNK
jgi:hypothetical protein